MGGRSDPRPVELYRDAAEELAARCDILKNERRRRVLRYLDDERETTIADVSEHLASIENPDDLEFGRKAAYVGLYQTHLDRLESSGYLTFDEETGEISIRDRQAVRDAIALVDRVRFLTPDDGLLFVDIVFELLKSVRRQAVVRYLETNGGSADITDLSEHVAAFENGVSVSDLESDERKKTYVSLYQVHIPKMADAGVLSFDEGSGEVTLGTRNDALLYLLSEEFPSLGTREAWSMWKLRERGLGVF